MNSFYKKPAKDWICGAVFLIVFLTIAFYGGAEIWFESLVFSAVFFLGGAAFWRGDFLQISSECKKLLAPLFVLAAFSFLQFFSTLLIQYFSLENSLLLPYSFDLTASFRSGLKILAGACFFLLFLASLRRNFRLSIFGLVVTGNSFALFGIFRFFVQARFPENFPARLVSAFIPAEGFGTFLNQNHFALLMLMTLGLNTGLFWFGRLEISKRICLLVLSLISWSAIVLTASRGGIISSFIVAGVLTLFASAKNKPTVSGKNILEKFLSYGKPLVVFAFVLLALISGIIFIGQDRVLHRFEEIPAEVDDRVTTQTFQRIDAWSAGVEIFREHPLFGTGFGGYQYAVSKFIDISGQTVPRQAHNDYLEFAVSSGAVGIFFGAWFLYRFLSVLKKRFKEPGDNFVSASRIGAVCGISGVALHSFFDFGLQFTGNFLFFTAMTAIVIFRVSNSEHSKSGFSYKNSIKLKIIFLTAFLIPAIVSGFYGYFRFNQIQSKNFTNELIKFPFDAEYYAAKSDAYFKKGNSQAASNELEKAIFYRPKDYALRLRHAQSEETLNNFSQAKSAYQKSVELAPLYGEPHFYFGKFLVNNDLTDQGFKELAFSFQRDSRFSAQVLEIISEKTAKDDLKLINLLLPLNDTGKIKLARFLMERESYDEIIYLNCASDFPPYLEDFLVRQLLEKKRFQAAWKIDQTVCGSEKEIFSGFLDGGFEAGELRKGRGFGWRIGNSVERKNLNFDEENPFSGKQSLQFILDGDFKTHLISQIVPVEKNTRYQLDFSYKTDEIEPDEIPVLQILLRQNDSEFKAGDIEFSNAKTGWEKSRTEFQTNGQTEAIEIRLVQKPCGQAVCSIKGNIWIDGFEIKKVSGN